MSDAWAAEEFDRRLARGGRVVVLFEATWCPHSRIFAPLFEEADTESTLRFARADLSDAADPRWRAYGIERTPTVAYYEHGEELERVESLRHQGLDRDRFESFLETVHELQEPSVSERKLSRARSEQQRAARAGGPTRRGT